jgi:hypothetical protein
MDDEMLEKITRRLHELAQAGLCVSVDEGDGGIPLKELYAIIDEEFGPGAAAAYEAALPRALRRGH